MCPRCGLAPEDEQHRYYECCNNAQVASKAKEAIGLAPAVTQMWHQGQFWRRGLLLRGALQVDKPLQEDHIASVRDMIGDWVIVFTDGSGAHIVATYESVGVYWRVTPHGSVPAHASGNLKGDNQSVPRAELNYCPTHITQF